LSATYLVRQDIGGEVSEEGIARQRGGSIFKISQRSGEVGSRRKRVGVHGSDAECAKLNSCEYDETGKFEHLLVEGWGMGCWDYEQRTI
jgi:hypothetical protein